ncbi:MAG TPA: glycoside hydrolase family 43 protein [Bacillota bacterium]|nr:glycoside hydrolase family 43 protein [Bacillota bacterium]
MKHSLRNWLFQPAFCFALLGLTLTAGAKPEFRPGEVWLDMAGQPIQAHGGGILIRSNTYYWYGEDRTPGGRGAVACYSSTNLYDWKREGVVLPREVLPRVDGRSTFVERPKVLFNARTAKYVMWTHLEQGGYHFASAGIATADSPTGPFTFLHAIRPITNDIDFKPNDPDRQKERGGTYRDMNVFLDDDGQAYAFYSSEGNWTMYVVRLNADFTGPQTPAIENKTWSRVLVRRMREAPAPFKYKGRYYLVTSACTGWKANPADYAVADNILGPYQSKGNPCVGPDADLTFDSQSTYVLPVSGRPGQFIFMADRWKPRDLPDSRYIWLPLQLQADGAFTLSWRERWDLSVFDK